MYTKTTPHLLAFYIFIGNLYSQFDTKTHWNMLNSIPTFKSLKFIYFKPIINCLSVSSITIFSKVIMSECSSRTIHTSNRITTFKNEFCYLQPFHFLTI